MQLNSNYFEYMAQELRRLPQVGKKYTNGRLNYIERNAQIILLRVLNRFKQNDKGSEKLLTFGIHIDALKIEYRTNT